MPSTHAAPSIVSSIKQNADTIRTHKPVLKNEGLSDCDVAVIPIVHCNFQIDLGALSKAGGIEIVDPQLVTRNSYHRSLQNKKSRSTTAPSTPDIGVSKQLPSGPFDQLEADHKKMHARFSTNLWTVRKTAYAGAKQDGGRLLKQIAKQYEFSKQARLDPLLSQISTPELYAVNKSDNGKVIIDMNYVPFADTLSFFKALESPVLDWFTQKVVTLIDANLRSSKEAPLASVESVFRDKATGILHALSHSTQLTGAEIAKTSDILTRTIDYHFQHHGEVMLPVGNCHGDLTFQNMLIDSVSREICVFDFLDCFIESPLQDLAKLLQDCRHWWFFTQVKVKEVSNSRIMSIMDNVKEQLRTAYQEYDFWPLVHLLEVFCLIRVLPYVKKTNEKVVLFEGLERLMENTDGYYDFKIGGSTSFRSTEQHRDEAIDMEMISNSASEDDEEADIEQFNDDQYDEYGSGMQEMTVIVTAMAPREREIYPDGRPKMFTGHPDGYPMIVDSISLLDLTNTRRVIIALPRSTVYSTYKSPKVLLDQFKALGPQKYAKVELVLLEKDTIDVLETVSKVITSCDVQGPIFIKDSDNRFAHCPEAANYVTTINLVESRVEAGQELDLGQKAFCHFSYDNILSNVAEESNLSSTFCAGGYSMVDASTFLTLATTLRHRAQAIGSQARLKMSDVMWQMIMSGYVLVAEEVQEYDDWGSLGSWRSFVKSFNTEFVNLDEILLVKGVESLNMAGDEQNPHSSMEAISSLAGLLKRQRTTVILTTKYPASHVMRIKKYLRQNGLDLSQNKNYQVLHSMRRNEIQA